MPGLVAGVLKLFDVIGLGEPQSYTVGVELVFCAVSLTIPAGMYFAARSHFGETAARTALIAGAFWYELCGFAHKPMAAVAASVSAAGLLNALPNQDRVYKAWSTETGEVTFLGFRDAQDPVYAAYRWLATLPDVGAVWHADRHYHATPGYYHLHHDVPLFDIQTGGPIATNPSIARAMVTHIVTNEPDARYPGYSEGRTFGATRVLVPDIDVAVLQWQQHVPTLVSPRVAAIMQRIDPAGPTPPPNAGIQFELGGLEPLRKSPE